MSLSCIKATALVEKQSAIGLSFFERIKLNMHLKMCDSCKNYKDNSQKIDALMKDQTYTPVKLSDEAKEEIMRKCEE